MVVLITGATGFVGSHLVPALLAKGTVCRLLVRSPGAARELYGDSVEFFEGDVTDPGSLRGVAEGITHVIHMAAMGHVSAISEDAFRQFHAVNVEGTRNLLAACAGHGIQHFVHFSSTAAMGLILKKTAIDERDEPRPATPYQESKRNSELAALECGERFGIPVTVIRPCMIYGKGGTGEFHKFCRLMVRGVFPRVGLGRNLTPLVHVRDVVQCAILAAEKGSAGATYLVASERSIPLAEMRALILDSWGVRAFYPFVPRWLMLSLAGFFEFAARVTGTVPLATRRNILSTVASREFSIEKARRELGYRPAVRFEDGIAETVAWFKEGLK